MSEGGRYNGAYYYSKELSDIIIPRITTSRNWVTINIHGFAADHSIVFIHNNLQPEHYDWLKRFKDLVLVVGVPETADKVKHLGKVIYLPLSIDVDYVKQFKTKHDREVAYCGRPAKFIGKKVDGDLIGGIPREQMLKEMAHYKKIYAVGRTALEALVLGAELLPYDSRFMDVDRWKVMDSKNAAVLLQRALDMIEAGATNIDCSRFREYKDMVQ